MSDRWTVDAGPVTLVIGYGPDGAAGRSVASAVARRRLRGVAVRSVPQLMPEHALDLAGVRRVGFVGASIDATVVTTTEVDPVTAVPGDMTHHGDPGALLALAAMLGETPDDAFVVLVPARDPGSTSDLYRFTLHGVSKAVDVVVGLTRVTWTVDR